MTMPKAPIIYPAVLSYNWRDYSYKIKAAARYFNGVQIDMIDEKFAKKRTWQDFSKINRLKPKNLFFEIQLMVKDPLLYILECAKVADRYIIHIESIKQIRPLIILTRGLGKSVGLAVDYKTPVSRITPYIKDIDMALVMTIRAGKAGQKLIPEALLKVKALHEKAPRLPLEVDGGINEETIAKAASAGANMFVVGSYLWRQKDMNKAKNRLLENVKKVKKSY